MDTKRIATAKAAHKLMAIIEEFRKLNVEMQAQQMAIFLAVMAKPDITMTELAQQAGLATSSVSRNVAAMSKTHRKGMPGLDVMVAYEDPLDRRHKRVKFTPKGQLVVAALEKLGETL